MLSAEEFVLIPAVQDVNAEMLKEELRSILSHTYGCEISAIHWTCFKIKVDFGLKKDMLSLGNGNFRKRYANRASSYHSSVCEPHSIKGLMPRTAS